MDVSLGACHCGRCPPPRVPRQQNERRTRTVRPREACRRPPPPFRDRPRRSLTSFFGVIELLHHLSFVALVVTQILDRLFLALPLSYFTLLTHTSTEANAALHHLTLTFAAFFVLLSWVRVMKFLQVIKEVGVLVEVSSTTLHSRKAHTPPAPPLVHHPTCTALVHHPSCTAPSS